MRPIFPRAAQFLCRSIRRVSVTVAPHIALSLRIRELRGELSQTDIARNLGLSYQSYQRLENPRKANPTIKTLERTARVYGRELTISI
ncbi:MAG: helix-turn-helix transcriptional regulator [Treponema sp.]|nr:helix-turn-helix transcriptional regulator [Treponema sp.]